MNENPRIFGDEIVDGRSRRQGPGGDDGIAKAKEAKRRKLGIKVFGKFTARNAVDKDLLDQSLIGACQPANFLAWSIRQLVPMQDENANVVGGRMATQRQKVVGDWLAISPAQDHGAL